MNHKTILSPDQQYIDRARLHQNKLTKPTGALGELEDVACWLAGIQQTNAIKARPSTVLVFAADHPISHHGVSAYPREVTGAMVQNILAGGAASSVLCAHLQLPLHVVDVGVDTPYSVPSLSPQVTYNKVEHVGSVGNLFETDAMDAQCLNACLSVGQTSIDSLNAETKIVRKLRFSMFLPGF